MSCAVSVLICIGMCSTYVGSFYVWRNAFDRNHPTTIKKRSLSVFIMMILSAVVVYFSVDPSEFKDYSYWKLLGLRSQGFFQASLYPLLLTMVLFSGPLLILYFEGTHTYIFDIDRWLWLRNHIIAPIAEEFTFRACMLPILVPCFRNYSSMVICSLFFGIAHLHHLPSNLSRGMNVKRAIMESLFQFIYTSAFGAYSCFLFLRTGHFVAPLIAHMFCNHMGFPDFAQVSVYDQPKRGIVMFMFVFGLIAWMFLLTPLTNPSIYNNELYLE